MDSSKVLEFIQEISRPLSAKIFWNIERKDIQQYMADIDAMIIAFEINLSECLVAEDSYAKQLPEIKDRLSGVLKKIQGKRNRYEFAVKECTSEYNNLLSSTADEHSFIRKHKPSSKEQGLKDKINHIKNIIAQFKFVLEPNIKRAIKYIEKKVEDSSSESVMVVLVEDEDNRPDTNNDAASPDVGNKDTGNKQKISISPTNTENNLEEELKAPYYKLVRVEKKYLGKVYNLVVDNDIIMKTDKRDFIYYFSGEGKQPSKQLMMYGHKLFPLAVLLKDFIVDDDDIWVKTGKIFGNVKDKSIKSKYSKYASHKEDSKEKEYYSKIYDDIVAMLEDIPIKCK